MRRRNSGVRRCACAELLLELDDVGELGEEERRDAGELVHLVDARACRGRPAGRARSARPWGPTSALRSVLRCDGRSAGVSSSRERIAFWNASLKVRPMAIASPTLFMCVVSSRSAMRELLERPARHLDDHVVERGLEAGRRLARDVVGDLVERVADGQLGGDLGDRKAGRLGGQRRAARDARVHLDDDDLAGLGVARRTARWSRRCRRRSCG